MSDLRESLTQSGTLYGFINTIVYAHDYNDLSNKPQINGVTLQNNKTASELGLVTPATEAVQSVNGETGNVVLDGDDIAYNSSLSVNQKIDAVEAAIPVVSYPVTSVNSKTGAVVLDDADIEHSSGVSVNSIINTMVGYIPVYGNTASGAIATFDTSLALPLQDCTIAINAVQESGTPTPSSPKAISGFTGANIHVADDENPHIIDNVTAITWQDEAGTVYGGSLDVTSGVLTITHRYRLMQSDAPSFTESITTNYTTYYTKLSNLYTDIKTTGFIDVISDKFVGVKTMAGNDTNIVYIQNGYANFRVNNGDFASASDFKTWIQTNGIELVYELATPVTYQLTPTQISAIVGTNNVFTDTNGDTSVVYACSLKDYIDSQ